MRLFVTFEQKIVLATCLRCVDSRHSIGHNTFYEKCLNNRQRDGWQIFTPLSKQKNYPESKRREFIVFLFETNTSFQINDSDDNTWKYSILLE